ncbi:MAG TPA: GlsB/YeaQ/YmgE family stress response membrane protein [Candidatus Binatia bacterium]|jgi:uncharacterized membrane protein YeaQ/YmgE (transglycosylase-associated protein family)
MSGISWILAGGIAGWLTGKLIGKKGYGESLSAGYAKSLDIFFGIIGASIGGYLFFWIVIGEAGSFSGYATAVLGSIVLVGFLRQVSARCLAFSLAGGNNISL